MKYYKLCIASILPDSELNNGHTVHCVRQTEVDFFEHERQNRASSSIRSDKMHAPSMTNKSPRFPVVILLLSVDLCTKCFFKWWQAAPMVSWDMVLSAIACHLRSSPPAHPSQPQTTNQLHSPCWLVQWWRRQMEVPPVLTTCAMMMPTNGGSSGVD